MFRIFILVLFSFTYLFANEELSLGNNDTYSILPYVKYSAVKEFNELPTDLKNNKWSKNKSILGDNTLHQAYWVKIKIKNEDNFSKELYLLDERRFVYALDYYLVKEGNVILHKKDGFYEKGNSSSFNATQRVFPLPLKVNETVEIFFKVQNYNMLDMPFQIVKKDYLINYFKTYSYLQGAFFVVLFVMVIYNLITYLIVNEKVYLYYLTYVSWLIVYTTGYFGYLKLFDIEPLISVSLTTMGAAGFTIFTAVFIQELFSLKQYLPKIDKVFNIIMWYLITSVIVYIISLFIRNFYLSQLLYNMLVLVIPLYVLFLWYALVYLTVKKVNKVVVYYAIIWTIASLLGLLLVIMHMGFLSIELKLEYYFQLGMCIESILFSLLLSFSIKEREEKNQAQQLMLIQQNKLASMGELVSAIAHQWRQPLSQINGQVLALDIDYKKKKLTDERLEMYLSEIEKITESMSSIISDFMNFFNNKKELEEFFISDIIDEAIGIARMSLTKKAKIINDVSEYSNILIKGYKSELIQAMLIIINNGVDAYQGNEIAVIKIGIKEIEKEWLEISIKDNGEGIENSVLLQAFEPYYTTKHKSQGTGLGLYILKMIIEEGMCGKVSLLNAKVGAVCTLTIPKEL